MLTGLWLSMYGEKYINIYISLPGNWVHFSQSPSRTAPRVILNMHRIHIDRVEAWEGVCKEEECVRREGGESGEGGEGRWEGRRAGGVC